MDDELYHLQHDLLLLGSREVKVFSATNIDELLDHLISKGEDHEDVKDERIPYFVELWPSAICLADLILSGKIDVRGKNILELGCGSGLSGVAAGMAGAASVLMTDYLQDALDFAARMWQLNLDSPPKTRLLDWRNPGIDRQFELILAADVAYEERNFQPLLHAFQTLLAPDGVIWLTEPSRQIARPFVSLLKENGFNLTSDSAPIDYQNHRHNILIHEIRRISSKAI